MMMLAEDQTVESALTLLVGLVTGALGSWATLRAANPKRRLAYWMATVSPILNASHAAGELLVMRGGQALRDPHVLDIRLTNSGRRDIASSHFDSQLPIQLDVGAPIVEILGITLEPASLHMPTVVMDGAALKIAPGLIARGQTLSFSLLVDGPTPCLSCRASLIDVTIHERRDANRQPGPSYVKTALVGLGIGVLVPFVAFWAGALWYGDFYTTVTLISVFFAVGLSLARARYLRRGPQPQPPRRS